MRKKMKPLPEAVQQAIEDESCSMGLSLLVQPRFGAYMEAWRQSKLLTLREVAEQSGVTPSTWLRAESGEDLRLSRLIRVLAWAVNNGLMTGAVTPETEHIFVGEVERE